MIDNLTMLRETLSAIEEGKYKKEETVHNLKLKDADIRNSKVYLPEDIDGLKRLNGSHCNNGRIETFCENADSFTVARKIAEKSNDKVLVLNLANPVHPGGGVRNGARAQEEDLCRKSTLLVSLEDKSAQQYYKYNNSLHTYMGSDAIFITPKVEILRDENGDWLEDSVVVSVMTCAAPKITYGLESMSQTEYEEMVYKRIQGMLKVAAFEGYRNLVLGAFGCGAFGNDAHIVSDLFFKALKETDFSGYRAEELFGVIGFAVLDRTTQKYNFNEFDRNFGENKFYATENQPLINKKVNYTKETEVYLDSIRGCMIGGAIGDALGYPVEFLDSKTIRKEFGNEGITEYSLSNGIAQISDDTQMSMFTANGVNYVRTKSAQKGIDEKLSIYMADFYIDWLETQKNNSSLGKRVSWLLDVPELYSQRAPGNTCLSAIEELKNIEDRGHSFVEWKRNNSKGCGAIMRVAPLALAYEFGPIENLDKQAAEISAITHCHPLGYITSAVLVHVINRIVFSRNGDKLKDIVLDAKNVVNNLFKGEKHLAEMNCLIDKAINLAENNNTNTDQQNISLLGEGWIAEETLAIGLYCALKYQNDFSKGIIAAVNHSGDSDSTGAVTGNILGAWLGYEKIEEKWKTNLELKDVILELADDLCYGCRMSEFGGYHDQEWTTKYIHSKRNLDKSKNIETDLGKIGLIGFYHEDEDYGCFSNWFLSDFEYAGKKYSSVEQYMMYQKVAMFQKYELEDQIMRTNNPAIIKKLGRTHFDNFNSEVWNSVSYTIVKRGVKAKFAQNLELLYELLNTGDSVLMECSKNDKIWGIGIDIESEERYNPASWKGKNQLGRILMSVRDELREELTLFDGDCIRINARDMSPIPEWKTNVSVLRSIPKYHNAINAYVETLNDFQKKSVLKITFEQIEDMMRNNMGGGLPIEGFFEMKQEIYEIATKCSKYNKEIKKIH